MALHGLPEACGVAFGVKRFKGDGAAAQCNGGDGWDGLPVEWRCGVGGHKISVSGGCRFRAVLRGQR